MAWFNVEQIAALAASGNQTAPALPGGIIAWIICNGRKRNAIGGWLLLFYWQLYSGLILSAVMLAANIQSYIPENFEDKTRFALFLVSAVPGIVLLLGETIVATFALGVQTPDMLKLLRAILGADLLAALVALAVDAKYFPDNEVFGVLALVTNALWLGYFFKSVRIRHVFILQDWNVAVNSIYPPKLRIAT